jgi:hypothetical protein
MMRSAITKIMIVMAQSMKIADVRRAGVALVGAAALRTCRLEHALTIMLAAPMMICLP